MSKNEWWTKDICFDASDLGYVMLQLPPIALPPIRYDNLELEPKQELHCSLLCIPKLVEHAGEPTIEPQLVQAIKTFVQSHDIVFEGFGAQLYLCSHEGVRSVVVAAKVSGVSELFNFLQEEFFQLQGLPGPSLHVTLYKYNHRYGIGIQNEAELKQLCRPIPKEHLMEVRKIIHG